MLGHARLLEKRKCGRDQINRHLCLVHELPLEILEQVEENPADVPKTVQELKEPAEPKTPAHMRRMLRLGGQSSSQLQTKRIYLQDD